MLKIVFIFLQIQPNCTDVTLQDNCTETEMSYSYNEFIFCLDLLTQTVLMFKIPE